MLNTLIETQPLEIFKPKWNTSCRNYKDSICKCGLATFYGCADQCVGYSPKTRTKVKNHLVSWKYSWAWCFLGLMLTFLIRFV